MNNDNVITKSNKGMMDIAHFRSCGVPIMSMKVRCAL